MGMLDLGGIIDMTPGSGVLATVAMKQHLPYLAIVRSELHQSYLQNILDRAALRNLADQESWLYNESLEALIQDHFAEVLAQPNEADLDDDEDEGSQ